MMIGFFEQRRKTDIAAGKIDVPATQTQMSEPGHVIDKFLAEFSQHLVRSVYISLTILGFNFWAKDGDETRPVKSFAKQLGVLMGDKDKHFNYSYLLGDLF